MPKRVSKPAPPCYTFRMTTLSIPSSSIFSAFIKENLDRLAFISAWLHARDIPHTIVNLAGKRHVVIRFAAERYDPRFRAKTLVAHYDRAPGTPGANDNSAACFLLLALAERLSQANEGQHNVMIILTDGEEAAGTKGISGQGSYALGSGLRKLRMTETDVYVFDACGRGDTLILSTAGMNRRVPLGLLKRLTDIHERTAELARRAARERWLTLPTPYSDNAGFLAAGIASQVVTVLPRDEANALLLALNGAASESERAALLEAIASNRHSSKGEDEIAGAIPETWKMMHTPRDSAESLSVEAFNLVERFLETLAGAREPLKP